MGLGVRGVLLAVAVLASSTLATRPAVSGVCDASCDVDCQTCCKSWSLQATCSDGTVIGENGGFATPGDAATGAASMPAPSTPCADHAAPKWTPYCAPENSVPSPLDAPETVSLVALTASLAQSLHGVSEAQQALGDFAEKRIVLKAGFPTISAAAVSLRQSRATLTEALGSARQLRVRGSVTAGEVSSLDKSTVDPRQQAGDAVKSAQALMTDETIIDAPAEARRKKAEEAAAAAKAAQEAAAAKAAELKKQRDDAAAAAKAAAEDRAQKAAADRAAAQQKRVQTDQAALQTSLDAAEKSRAETAAALATFLARSDVAPAAKTTGDQLSHRLSDLQPKIAATKTSVDAVSSAPTDEAVKTLAQAGPVSAGLSRDVAHAGSDVKAFTASPKNIVKAPEATPAAAAPAVAAPAAAAPAPPAVAVVGAPAAAAAAVPAPTPAPAAPTPAPAAEPVAPVAAAPAAAAPAAAGVAAAPVAPVPAAVVVAPAPAAAPERWLVRTCEIGFTSRATGVTLAVDRGQRVTLPARIKVASGRHTLSIQKGAAKSDKRELLLCGHLDTFPIEVP